MSAPAVQPVMLVPHTEVAYLSCKESRFLFGIAANRAVNNRVFG